LRVVRATGIEQPRRLAISAASKMVASFSSKMASACAPMLGALSVTFYYIYR
jgi:hypothetical protein